MSTKSLFVDLDAKESAAVSGGGIWYGYSPYKPVENGTVVNFNLNKYLFVLGAGVTFGVPGLTAEEMNFAFESAVELGSDVKIHAGYL